jgi:hypothetical protein
MRNPSQFVGGVPNQGPGASMPPSHTARALKHTAPSALKSMQPPPPPASLLFSVFSPFVEHGHEWERKA